MGNKTFHRLDQLSILTFLAEFELESNNNNASEGMRELFLPTFSKGSTLLAFEGPLHLDVADTDTVGIKTWVNSV